MKKILGVHPVLLAMLIIFLGLNLSEQLKSKPLDYEEYNNVLYQKPHTHQIDKDVKKNILIQINQKILTFNYLTMKNGLKTSPQHQMSIKR